jgi:hypothetical protein
MGDFLLQSRHRIGNIFRHEGTMNKRKVRPYRYYKNKLQQALKFTDEDLEANRSGYMTDDQRKYVKKHTQLKVIESEGGIGVGIIFFGIGLGLVSLCGIIGMYIPPFTTLGFIILCVFPQLLLGWIGSINKKLLDYQKIPLKGDICNKSGILWLQKGKFLSPAYIIVDSTSFLVKKEVHTVFSQLRREHKKWIIYYSPYNQCVLSAEPLLD